MGKLIIKESDKKCKLVLDTPYHHIETNTYIVFTKADSMNNIEINNMSLDDIREFQFMLDKIIKENEEKFKY